MTPFSFMEIRRAIRSALMQVGYVSAAAATAAVAFETMAAKGWPTWWCLTVGGGLGVSATFGACAIAAGAATGRIGRGEAGLLAGTLLGYLGGTTLLLTGGGSMQWATRLGLSGIVVTITANAAAWTYMRLAGPKPVAERNPTSA